MTAHLTMEQRQLARRLHAKGLSLREGGRQVGCSHEVVRTVVRRDSERPGELARCLPTGRVKRRARRGPTNTGQLRDMVMITERPADVEDRAVPGHWEGDLMIGTDCRSPVGTLVERTSRYVL